MNSGVIKAGCALSTLALTLSACGGQTRASEPSPPPPSAFANLSLIPNATSYNAVDFEKPTELAAESEVVISGTVVGIQDGYEVVTPAGKGEKYSIRDYSAVIEVKVEEQYKNSLEDGSPASSFISISRGATQEPDDGDGGMPTVASLEEIERAIPAGSEVVVMASAIRHPDEWLQVVDAGRGVPDGAVLLSGLHPQAMSFATKEGTTTAWGGLSMTELREELKKALA